MGGYLTFERSGVIVIIIERGNGTFCSSTLFFVGLSSVHGELMTYHSVVAEMTNHPSPFLVEITSTTYTLDIFQGASQYHHIERSRLLQAHSS